MTGQPAFELVPAWAITPPDLSGTMPRQNLLRQISAQGYKVVLLKAPPGYGKTSILTQFYTGSRASGGVDTLWISCAESDNDPMRIIQKFVASLLAAGLIPPDFLGNQLEEFGIPSPLIIADRLLAVLNQSRPIYIMMNDVDLITSESSAQLLGRMLEQSAGHVRIVASCGSAPAIAHAKLLLDGRMLVLGQDALRFTPVEVAELFRLRLSGMPSNKQLDSLLTLTDGWPVAIQYAALNIRHHTDLDHMIEDLRTGEQSLDVYFNEQVFKHQSLPTQQLLLKLALVEHFDGALCQLLAPESPASPDIDLQQLLDDNMFVSSTGDRKNCYRFHPLFRSYLLALADRTLGEARMGQLRSVAANWYWHHGWVETAIDLALLAGQPDKAASWLSSVSSEMVRKMGQLIAFMDKYQRLPASSVDQHPLLSQNYAWALCLRREFLALDGQLRRLRTYKGKVSAKDFSDIERVTELLECTALALKDNVTGVSSRIAQWLVRWDNPKHYADMGDYHFETAVACNVHGFATKCLSDFKLAKPSLIKAIQHYDACASHYGKAWAKAILVLMYAKQGAHNEARTIAREALEEVKLDLGETSHAAYMLSALCAAMLYETNEVGQAQAHLCGSIDYLKEQGSTDTLIAAYITAARIYIGQGNVDKAFDGLREGILWAESAGLDRLCFNLLDELICWMLRLGRHHDAARYAAAHQLSTGFDGNLSRHRICARAQINRLLCEHQFERAIAALHQLTERSRMAGQFRVLAEWLLLMATAQMAAGDASNACASLKESLEISRSQGYIRLYLDQSGLVLNTLRQCSTMLRHGAQLEFLATLLALPEMRPPEASVPHERLTSKETDITRYLEKGLVNKQIAVQLGISEGTVKWHIHNILGKLQAQNRSHAIRLAREQGYL